MSPQLSRILLSILANLNNAVVRMVSSRPLISKSSSSSTYPLVTVPSAPIIIGIIIIYFFRIFHNSDNQWFLTGVWVTTSLLKSPGLFSVFWPIIIIIYSFVCFSHQRYLMLSFWSLNDNRSPQASRTHLSILADLNNSVIWMVSTYPFISKSSNLLTHTLGIVPSTPIRIGITVTFMFHSLFFFFFRSLAMSRYLSLFSLAFIFTPWSIESLSHQC